MGGEIYGDLLKVVWTPHCGVMRTVLCVSSTVDGEGEGGMRCGLV